MYHLTFDISCHLIFHVIWHFMSFDISCPLTFHVFWHYMYHLPTSSFKFLTSTKMNSLQPETRTHLYSVPTPFSQCSFWMTLLWGDLPPDFCDKKSQVLHEFNCLIFNFPVERISHIWRLKYLLSLSLCRYFAQFSSCHPTPPATVSYFLCFDEKKFGTNYWD